MAKEIDETRCRAELAEARAKFAKLRELADAMADSATPPYEDFCNCRRCQAVKAYREWKEQQEKDSCGG